MRRNRMKDAYFEWMLRLVSDYPVFRRRPLDKLLTYLYNTEFVYILDMDTNRANDGLDLRYRFAYETGRNTEEVAEQLDDEECNILEMMVALALRVERHIMDDPSIGNRTGKWVWDMIVSLGLSSLDDAHFNQRDADSIITRFLRREYEPDGRGGLFTLPNSTIDLRYMEIWYQMMGYLNTIE